MQSQRKELKSTTLIYAKLPVCDNMVQHLGASAAEGESKQEKDRRHETENVQVQCYSEKRDI